MLVVAGSNPVNLTIRVAVIGLSNFFSYKNTIHPMANLIRVNGLVVLIGRTGMSHIPVGGSSPLRSTLSRQTKGLDLFSRKFS